jgi:DNA-binding FrmR family transcriptional regulator
MEKVKKNTKSKQDLILDRISRIEGQLRGIRRMINEKTECIDVITQVTAIRSAISVLGIELMKEEFCKKGSNKKIDEAYLKTLFKIS